MDALSDVLSLLRLEDYGSAAFDAGGQWCIAFPKDDGIRFYALMSGECWLQVDGVPDPLRVRAGDCLLLPHGRAARLATDLTLPPYDAYAVFENAQGGIATLQGGGDLFGVGGFFELAADPAELLIGMLPPIVHIAGEQSKAMLVWCVESMMQEIRNPLAGSALVAKHLATMILVAALRLHVTEETNGIGWLFALADPQMAFAINAMHEDPAQRWTLPLLAQRSGMSRTGFAMKFKKTVGVTPMEYLTRWRMARACDRLVRSDDSIAQIAFSLGYESESAFSAAFKRIKGRSPRSYGRLYGSR